MKLFNTETRTKQAVKEGKVTLYTCGPTIYNFVHIGNLRTFIFEDLLRRTLKLHGRKVEQVMNLTDIDDKTIKGALAKGVSLREYTEVYERAFFEDIAALRIEKVEHYPAATAFIPQMIKMIEVLLQKGIAYRGQDKSVYFSIEKFPRYGCLSHLKLDELKIGARVDSDEYDKESLSDFVLWKAYDPKRDGQIYWESPFGPGRPGWHLECSTMAMEILGETVDIHCGGIDNLFPHHENEIAQSEGCSGKPFVRHWMHAEHLVVDGRKMSKSLGNFYTLRDLFQKGYKGEEVRYMLLHTHYRSQLNFTFEELNGVRTSLERLHTFVRRLQEMPTGQQEGGLQELSLTAFEAFKAELGDDLNISAALAALFDFVRDANALLDEKKVSKKEVEFALQKMREMNAVLDVISFEAEVVPPEIERMAQERQEARKRKDFARADELRDALAAAGYVVEDTAQGPRIKVLTA
ncbi:MAG: cysteine--tRNA ligase [Verrucomicrobia bacterium]|nr:cysteine--tRNA ligase [Verrucomicrobiota bacterium]